jgi:hypothetical protein
MPNCWRVWDDVAAGEPCNSGQETSMISTSRLTMVALALAIQLAIPVQAQTIVSGSAAVKVERFTVDPMRSLVPGTELAFSLTATPGASVSLQMVGATGEVRMNEIRPGIYLGDYTVRLRDRLTAASLVTAVLRRDGQVLTVALDQSLVRGAPAPLLPVHISAFTVSAPNHVLPGDELNFQLRGATGGKVRVLVAGVTNPIWLTETGRGRYDGQYTVSRRDRLRDDLAATAILVVDRQEASQRFERQAVASAWDCERAPQGCGVVTAIERVELKDGSPNNAAGVAGGVIGGAYAGSRGQADQSRQTLVRITVRLENGVVQSFDQELDPGLQVGAQVHVADGAIVR